MGESALNNFLKNKKEVKRLLTSELGFSGKKPLLAVILDKELSEFEEIQLNNFLEGTESVDVQIAILADTNLEGLKTEKAKIVDYNRQNRKHVLEAADMALSFSFSDVEEMMLNGAIPISLERPEVKDYNPNQEVGNSFTYKKIDKWCIFAALVRALETFKFPYDWNNIVRQGLESVEVN